MRSAPRDLLNGSIKFVAAKFLLKDTSKQNRFVRSQAIKWLALAFLVSVVIWSWNSLNLSLQSLNFVGLLPTIALAVAATFLSALEFRISCRYLGHRGNSIKDDLKITSYGSMANVLPIPGGTVVRIAALKSSGATTRTGTQVTFAIGAVWLGLSCILSGAILSMMGDWIVGTPLFGAGVVVYLLSYWIAHIEGASRLRFWLTASGVEIMVILVAGLRNFCVLYALGFGANLGYSFGLVAAGSIAVATSVVPAGIGVRELIAGGLGMRMGLGAGPAFMVASLNQLISLLAVIPIFVIASSGRSEEDE